VVGESRDRRAKVATRLSRVRTRRFGDTDLEASEIGFGTWALGSTWWGEVSEESGERLLLEALDLGVTFFETGDAYGQGANEELVGRVLGPHRDRIQLSSKFGYVLDSNRREHSEGERPQRWDGPFVRRALEASLKRLGTDHLDLYQLHNPRLEAIDSDECFATLDELQGEGKIAQYGVALGPAIGWRDEGLRAIRGRRIASVQTVYNLLEQDPGRDFLEAASGHGVGVIARVPTSSGLLDDNLTPQTTFGPGDHRRHRPREWLVEGLDKIERIRFLCGPETGRTMAQAALRFILAQPQMTVVIPTITNRAELREYAGATNVPDLTDEELTRVEELYSRNFEVALAGPG
jgi:aryl-alcohol dehydrogenase-like predicted oxidoreductase